MVADQRKRTNELLSESRQTLKAVESAIEGLGKVREEVNETITYIQWWRFLGYDTRAVQFLENLDMGNQCREQ